MKRKEKSLKPEQWKLLQSTLADTVDSICNTPEEKAVFQYLLDHTIHQGKIEVKINLDDLVDHVSRRFQEQHGRINRTDS
jgi:hypothetical protein